MPQVFRALGGGGAVLAMLGSVVLIAQQSQHELFERARLLEDSNQDLAEAISLYEQVADQANGERVLAAPARLRLGLLYARLGRQSEARNAYERVLRDYAEQTEIATVIQEIATGEMKRLTDERPMISYGGFAFFPVPSPDGQTVVTTWFNEEYFFDLRLVDLEGGAPRTLYRNEEVNWAMAVGWTPDGSQILAQLGRTDRTNQIALISVADGSTRTLKSFDWREPSEASPPTAGPLPMTFHLRKIPCSGTSTFSPPTAAERSPSWNTRRMTSRRYGRQTALACFS